MMNDEFSMNPIEQAFSTENSQEIMDLWKQSTELQEEIIPNLVIINNITNRQRLIGFFKDRFPQTSDKEKNNILVALSKICYRDPELQSDIIKYIGSMPKEHPELNQTVINCLKDISSSLVYGYETELNRDGEFPTKISENLNQIFSYLIQFADGDYGDQIKMNALQDIFRYKFVHQEDHLVSVLKKLIETGSPELSTYAFSELAGIVDSSDGYYKKALKNEIEKLDPKNCPKDDLLRLIIILNHTGDSSHIPFLEDLKNKYFLGDNECTYYIDHAIKAIKLRGANET